MTLCPLGPQVQTHILNFSLWASASLTLLLGTFFLQFVLSLSPHSFSWLSSISLYRQATVYLVSTVLLYENGTIVSVAFLVSSWSW